MLLILTNTRNPKVLSLASQPELYPLLGTKDETNIGEVAQSLCTIKQFERSLSSLAPVEVDSRGISEVVLV
jgi:hypothetical protein